MSIHKPIIWMLAIFVFVHLPWTASLTHAATLHAIIVGDTSDDDIGKSVTADVAMARQFATNLGAHYEKRSIIALTGHDATDLRLVETIRNLDIGVDDFVFLYYSGHGTTGVAGSPWPLLALGDEGIESRSVLLKLSQQVPSRLLAVFDACNGSQEMPARRQPASGEFRAEHVDKLFKQLNGSVIATSSKAPFVSYADKGGRGSRFSTAFFETMTNALTAPAATPTWNEVLRVTGQKTEKVNSKYPQIPKYALTSGVR